MSQNIKDPTALSRLFHLNSEPWLDESGEPPADFLQQAKTHPHAPRVSLPTTEQSNIDHLAAARRSVRAFADEPLPLQSLAAVLRSGYQAIGPDPLESGQSLLRRPVPSAGGLYPLELYALVRNVEGVTPGVYHYDAISDALEHLSDGTWQDHAPAAFLTWPFVQNAPAIICIGAVFDRSQAKYGPRGYRYILLEAGHVGQNLSLRTSDLALSSLFLGGFNDRVLNNMVGLDGLNEAVLYTMALGVSASE